MSDHAAFEQRFGAALAADGGAGPPVSDPALARALAIHRNTSTKAAMDALADNYPVVRALCGDEAFAGCAYDYTAAHLLADPRLCFYGEWLAEFIAAYPLFADIPWLADVAALEWLCIEALFAADAPNLDGVAIAAGLDPARALWLHPAVRFATFDAPVAAIWLAHQPDASSNALTTIAWDRRGALVTRVDGSVRVTELDADGTAFLAACAAGASLAEAAAIAASPDLATLFATLITAGAFA